MEYNTQREKLLIPEYGRNLQKIIEKAVRISDRDKRTQMAYLIVDIMAQIHSSQVKDSGDLRHKLWDHLHIMADFELDVDSPYPIPDREVLYKKPNRLEYPKGQIKYNYYGRNIQSLIEEASNYEDGPEKEALVKNIANNMKKAYLTWNRDSVDDDLITKHLAELSNNSLHLPEDEQLTATHEILGQTRKKKQQKGQKGQKNGRRKNKQN